jgi:hypothetical protein
MMNKRLVPLCAAGVGAVLLAGCGGQSADTPSKAGASRTSSASSPVASPSASAPTRAHLEDILLQLTDLPSGSESRPNTPSGDATAQAEKASCVGVRVPDAQTDSNAVSDDFAFPGRDVIVTSSGRGYPSQSSVDEYVAMVQSPKFSHCYELLLQRGARADRTFEEVSVSVIPGSAGGPANVFATGTSVVKMTGQAPVTLNLAFIRGPLMTAEIIANGMNGAPVPSSQMEPLVAAVANRAAQG